MLRFAVAIILVSGLAACRKPPVNQVDLGFSVATDAIDFGRVLENDTATKTLTVLNTSEVPLSVDVATAPPFSAMTPLELQGGASVDLAVSFLAGSTLALGTLVLSQPDVDAGFTVMLSGLGVHPLDCVPSGPCHQSMYDLTLDRCVDSVSADGAMCTPTSTCLEKGQCLAGTCIGVPRSCDDNNQCTVDGCAEGIGCVNSPVVCPTPTDPCHVATCNPNSGCGEMPAAEGTVCGAVDCTHANVCDPTGQCITIPTPDGFPCSPPTPCQAQGTCSEGLCTRPPATILMPDLALPVGGAPPSGRPMLMTFGGEIFGEVCALPLDPPDAGDGGLDAGNASDAGLDGGDGGASDGGPTLDAGAPPDGGTCALISYTENGFERFTAKFDDTRERAFLHAANPGVALLEPSSDLTTASLEVRSLGDGTLRSRVDFSGAVVPGGVAADSNGTPWALVADGDGGTHLMLVTDGGARSLVALDGSVQLLALDERGGAWVSGPAFGTAARLFVLADGGLSQDSVDWLSAPDAATFTLATTELSGVVGNRQLFDPDAGLVATFDWTDDAGEPLRVQERFSLMSAQRSVIFYKACPQAADELRARARGLAATHVLARDRPGHRRRAHGSHRHEHERGGGRAAGHSRFPARHADAGAVVQRRRAERVPAPRGLRRE